MDDGVRLLNAFRAFGSAVGDDAQKYVNIDEIVRNRDLMAHIRKSVERHIHTDYLPGFRFKDLHTFAWHFKHENYWHWYLVGGRITPSQFIDHWIRRLLLPNRYHYRAEIAYALQTKAKQLREAYKTRELGRPKFSWLNAMKEWLFIEDLDRGFSRRSTPTEPWGANYADPTPNTLMKWARESSRYREERLESDPPNKWTIISICYQGGQLTSVDAINQHVGKVNTGYLETWKWDDEKNSHGPRRRTMSFIQPSAPDSWNPPDRHFRADFS